MAFRSRVRGVSLANARTPVFVSVCPAAFGLTRLLPVFLSGRLPLLIPNGLPDLPDRCSAIGVSPPPTFVLARWCSKTFSDADSIALEENIMTNREVAVGGRIRGRRTKCQVFAVLFVTADLLLRVFGKVRQRVRAWSDPIDFGQSTSRIASLPLDSMRSSTRYPSSPARAPLLSTLPRSERRGRVGVANSSIWSACEDLSRP